MFSLQTIFGKGDKFYGLLEQAAGAAHNSTKALVDLVSKKGQPGSLEDFQVAYAKEKDIAAKISHELVNTFVTALDREDIEALGSALYKIPKTVHKFAERYALVGDRLADIDFSSRAAMLEKAATVLEDMVGQLRKGMDLEGMKALNDKMQAIESEADRKILELYKDLYVNETDAAKFLVRKDLFEILEKAIDRCRDAGNVIYHIVLKNS